ncbi:hypothetical protein BGX26_009890 [Mortierella sp. AD094]|nr:hypothetical protein BGX26_009890 [Mortierella sp. AD094]
MYIKAVNDLWGQQKVMPASAAAMNTEKAPRTPKVSAPMEEYRRRYAAYIISKDVKGGFSFERGNGRAHLKQMMKTSWTRNYLHQGSLRKQKLLGFRLRLACCWSHFMMSRASKDAS